MTSKEIYRENIIAHWDFRKGSLSDQSENGFGITTLTGSPEWIRNKFGRALGMYGSERVTLGKILGTSSTISALTVVIRVRPQVDATLRRILCKFSGAGTTAGNIILDMNVSNPGDIRWGFANNTPTHELTVSAAGVLVNNKEQIIIATFDGSTNDVNAFVDGVQVIDSTFTLSAIPLYDYNWFLGEDGGIDSQQFKGDYNEAMIINAALTPLQASQLYTEMKKEAHLNYIPTRTVLPAGDFTDTNLIAGWDMVNNDGTVYDSTGGGENGTVTLPATQVDGMLGKGMQFYGSEGGKVTVSNGGDLDDLWPGGATFMCWANLRSDGGTSVGRLADKTRNLILVGGEASGFLKFRFRHDFTTSNCDYTTTNAIIPINTPVHLAVVYTAAAGNIPTLYLNSVSVPVSLSAGQPGASEGTPQSDAGSNLILGSDSTQAATTDGWLSDMRYYTGELTQVQIQAEMEKSKSKLNYYSEGKDWNVSTGNVTAGELENTDWEVVSGTWQVDDSKQKVQNPNYATNGTFDTDTIWTKGSGWTISGGTANFAATGSPANLNQNSSITAGKTYEVIYTISNYSAGNIKCTPGGYNYSVNRSANGTYTEIVAASNPLSNNQIYFTADATFTGSIDNVSVREIRSDGRKQITNIVSGRTALSTKSNQAFGTWEFDIKVAGIGTSRLPFAISTTDAIDTPTGYYMEVLSTGSVRLRRSNGGSSTELFTTTTGIIRPYIWHRIKITRSVSGIFTGYYSVNAGLTYTIFTASSGANPTAAETTYVSSNYTTFEANAADTIRNFKFSPVVQ